MKKNKFGQLVFSFLCFLLVTRVLLPFNSSLNLDKLSFADAARVDSILAKLAPVIEQKIREGAVAGLTFEEIEAPLDEKEKEFLSKLRGLNPRKAGVLLPYRGIKPVPADLVKISNQPVKASDGSELGAVYLPAAVSAAYEAMMLAMEKDLGSRLYIRSAYRPPAHQLYNFLFYLKKRNYNIRDTAKWNALPGYSEHGDPDTQALDFISEGSVDDDLPPMMFEALPEYGWLLEHAGQFGFELSYPKDNPSGIGYEPWHWRYCGQSCSKADSSAGDGQHLR